MGDAYFEQNQIYILPTKRERQTAPKFIFPAHRNGDHVIRISNNIDNFINIFLELQSLLLESIKRFFETLKLYNSVLWKVTANSVTW